MDIFFPIKLLIGLKLPASIQKMLNTINNLPVWSQSQCQTHTTVPGGVYPGIRLTGTFFEPSHRIVIHAVIMLLQIHLYAFGETKNRPCKACKNRREGLHC